MKSKIILLFLAFVCLFEFNTNAQNIKEITILHWNDFHSYNVPFLAKKGIYPEIKDSAEYLGGYAYLSGTINAIKKVNPNVVVMNAGDDFQGTPVSMVTKGFSQVIMMNHIMPDVVTLGNHDFDYSADTLIKFLKKAKYDVINANLLDVNTGKNLFSPYKIVNENEVRMVVIGLMSPEFKSLVLPDNIKKIQPEDIFISLKYWLNYVKKNENPDLIVVLSHCGFDVDKIIADSFPAVNVIIGGHSHSMLNPPVKHNKTIICQAGSKGRFLGKIDLKVNIDGDSVQAYSGELIPMINKIIKPDTIMVRIVNEFEEIANKGLNEVIGKLETNWITGENQETNIGNWEADVMRDYTKADIAFQNSGGIRKSLASGNITIRDIWEINPFGNLIITFSVTGDSLKQILEHQASDSYEKVQISGIRYEYNPKKPFGKRIVKLTVGGKQIDGNKRYVIATNNYVFTQHAKFFGFSKPLTQFVDKSLVDKEIFVDAVRKQKVIRSVKDGRMKRVN